MIQMYLNQDSSESILYNLPDFPAYIRRSHLQEYPNYRALSHWHSDFEMIVILRGCMDYNVNGQIIHLEQGEGIFVNSGRLHYGFSDEACDCEFLCLVLHPSILSSNPRLIREFLTPFQERENLPFLKLTASSETQKEILHSLKKLYEAFIEQQDLLAVVEYLSKILRLISASQSSSAPPLPVKNQEDLNMLYEMVGFIQASWQQKISVRDISAAGGCCKTKASRLFRDYLHTSPACYLTDYRIKKGMELLKNTADPVTEIALECGFAGTSYFCEIFRKVTGMTPGDYRGRSNL